MNTGTSANRLGFHRIVAGEKVQRLSASAQQIGTIVDLITDIAGETNLLALTPRSRRRAPSASSAR